MLSADNELLFNQPDYATILNDDVPVVTMVTTTERQRYQHVSSAAMLAQKTPPQKSI